MVGRHDLAGALPAVPPGATPRPAASRGDVAGARKAADEFASFFFAQSLESVFGNMSPDATFGGGSAETVFKSLLTQEYGKIVARGGGLGIADAVQREILRLQEKA